MLQAYRAERDARAGQVTSLVEELKTARTATDAYRQAVRNRTWAIRDGWLEALDGREMPPSSWQIHSAPLVESPAFQWPG
ncbi:hypothetical protein D3C72_1807650 [compost metagenome]